MPDKIVRPSRTPLWIQQFSDEIDALEFGPGFDRVGADTEWSFGTKKGRGAEDLKAFFRKIDGDLNSQHRLLETWSSDAEHIIRGEADVSPKDGSKAPVTTPFVWIFYMDGSDLERLLRVFIVNGPIKTDSVL